MISDDFYKSPDINIEKKKFRALNSLAKNNEINILRAKIKDNTKALNSDGRRVRDPKNKKSRFKRGVLGSSSMTRKSPTVNQGFIRKGYKKSTKVTEASRNNYNKNLSTVSTNREQIDKNNSLQDPKKLYAELVKEDKEKFEKQMDDYQNHLNDLKENLKEEDVIKAPKKFTFLTEDLKILNYKPTANLNVVEKKDDNNQIEIKKLVKFTKKGKRLNKIVKEAQMDAESNLDLSQRLMDFNNNNTGSGRTDEEGGTVQLVKNEIINSININEIFNKKKIAMKDYLKDTELPKLEDYESKIYNFI